LTSTKRAPWYVIPSNHKWFRNLAISQIIADTMDKIGLKLPPTHVTSLLSTANSTPLNVRSGTAGRVRTLARSGSDKDAQTERRQIAHGVALIQLLVGRQTGYGRPSGDTS
jgi:hypothetical protein